MGEIPDQYNEANPQLIPPKPHPETYQPQEWNQEFYEPGSGSVDPVESEVAAPPLIPGGDPGGGTPGGLVSVATPTLHLFAANLNLLEGPVRDGKTRLTTVNTHSGGFHDAFLLDDKATKIADEATMLLNFVHEGLMDIQSAVHKMVARYDGTEDLNKMKATELADILDEVDGDITATKGLGGFKAGGTTAGSGSTGSPS